MNSRALRHWRLMLTDETGERKISGCYILQDTKCWEKRLQEKAVKSNQCDLQTKLYNQSRNIIPIANEEKKNLNHDKLQTLTQLY